MLESYFVHLHSGMSTRFDMIRAVITSPFTATDRHCLADAQSPFHLFLLLSISCGHIVGVFDWPS